MRKQGKTKDAGQAAEEKAPIQSGQEQEESRAERPRRGRKPKAAGKKDHVENVQEDHVEPADKTAEETAAEPEKDTGEAAGTDSGMGESAGKAEAAQEVVEEAETAQESAEETEAAQESLEETQTVPVPFPGASTQIVESPLKRMKQEFQQRSQVIKEQMRNIQNAFITIGFQLHWIRENNMYRVLNYKNIYDYAEKEYGIKRTTCCNFICIIENYAERDENGEVVESIADCYRNYSASQLVAMLGMPEEMKQQVTPDMSVRAITRLRKGETEKPVAAETVLTEVAVPAKDGVEDAADAKTPVPGQEARTDGLETPETADVQETDSTVEKFPEISDDDTAAAVEKEVRAVEIPAAVEDTAEETETAGSETDGGRQPGQPEGTDSDVSTLAEIDSYSDFQSMADELDLIMKHVFSGSDPVRVKIVCVQG